MDKKNVIIIGAAGRDFHNFNTYYRDNDNYRVVAFTAAQIPDIDGRIAGTSRRLPMEYLYIHDQLPELIKELDVDAYSHIAM